MAPKSKSRHRANLGIDHGKAVLCSNIHQKAILHRIDRGESRVRICTCGARIKEHELTDNRVAWSCQGCKRYEVIRANTEFLTAPTGHNKERENEDLHRGNE